MLFAIPICQVLMHFVDPSHASVSRPAAFRPKLRVHQNSSSLATSFTLPPRATKSDIAEPSLDQLYRRDFYRSIFESELELHRIAPMQFAPQSQQRPREPTPQPGPTMDPRMVTNAESRLVSF
jgi:hypothetical protein